MGRSSWMTRPSRRWRSPRLVRPTESQLRCRGLPHPYSARNRVFSRRYSEFGTLYSQRARRYSRYYSSVRQLVNVMNEVTVSDRSYERHTSGGARSFVGQISIGLITRSGAPDGDIVGKHPSVPSKTAMPPANVGAEFVRLPSSTGSVQHSADAAVNARCIHAILSRR